MQKVLPLVLFSAAAASCNYSLHGTSTSSAPPGPSSSSSRNPDVATTAPGGDGDSHDDGDSARPSAHEPAAASHLRSAVPLPDGWPSVATPAMPAGPAPQLSFVSPAADEQKVGASTASADDAYENLSCLQDARSFTFKLAAKNWTVAPGGPGVLLVVDGVYATVVHDLTRPVKLADLELYEHDSFSSSSTFGIQ